MKTTNKKEPGTKERALKEGRALLQTHGYNGFSFQDIANLIGIKKPSLYDHFGSKEELTVEILKSYSEMFDQWSLKVEKLNELKQIRQIFLIFYNFAKDQKKICPILALSVDANKLTKDIHREMKAFTDKWLIWLECRIKEGQKKNIFRKDLDAKETALFVYSQIMGSQFQVRLQNNPDILLKSGDLILDLISVVKTKTKK